ncbi:hypothetical protein [Methanocella conradii]|uniref:hypothetical protein n=1 Tax=Methanocella conradii TaxID=1175444 RepID=UPI00157E0363|nr:hypothetical protein [Methanocella conradii]
MVSFVASGGAGGIDHVEYSLNGMNWTTGNFFNITGEGWNRVDYRAVDKLGIRVLSIQLVLFPKIKKLRFKKRGQIACSIHDDLFKRSG